MDLIKGAVLDDPVLNARLKGVGVMTAEDMHDYGGLGPTSRASGVPGDVRRDDHAAVVRTDSRDAINEDSVFYSIGMIVRVAAKKSGCDRC